MKMNKINEHKKLQLSSSFFRNLTTDCNLFAGDYGFNDYKPPGEGGGGGAVGGAGGRGRATPGGGQSHPSRLQVGFTREKKFRC
jgi:hypothetical protein